ncbi:MAG: hypothetical protein AAB467_00645 [Patescibacteria group bacterium]
MVYVTKNTDEEMSQHQKPAQAEVNSATADGGGVLNQLDPKTALIVGLLGSIMVLCTVGFVVLLWLVFR